MRIDTRDLHKWYSRFKKLSENGMDGFFEEQVKKGALLTQRNVVKTTPVATGYMRKSWHVDTAIKKEGDTYQVSVYNSARGEATEGYPSGAPYPYYIEYGRRKLKNGVTVGYVNGRKILKSAKEKAHKQLKRSASKDLQAYIDRVMKH